MSQISFEEPNKGKVTVGVTSTAVLAAENGRRMLILSNPSDEAITVTFGDTAAVLNEGIVIPPDGGLVLDTFVNVNAIKAICLSGGKVLSYSEFLN